MGLGRGHIEEAHSRRQAVRRGRIEAVVSLQRGHGVAAAMSSAMAAVASRMHAGWLAWLRTRCCVRFEQVWPLSTRLNFRWSEFDSKVRPDAAAASATRGYHQCCVTCGMRSAVDFLPVSTLPTAPGTIGVSGTFTRYLHLCMRLSRPLGQWEALLQACSSGLMPTS